jgi:hypothetical protein
VDGHAAPAGADLQQVVARLKLGQVADGLVLAALGVLQRVARLDTAQE